MVSRLCGCASAQCNCLVEAGDGISVIGTGSPANPYIISAEDQSLTGKFVVQDTPSIDLTLSGDGTTNNPFVLSGVASLTLGQLTDVDTSDTTAGYVLGRNAGGTFEMQPAPTAPPGTIITDASIDGDGSIGSPLSVHDFGPPTYQVFESDSTWSKPAGLHAVRVIVIGGGGAGGGCFSTDADEVSEGGGGGGGGYSERIIPEGTLPANVAVTVGEGGSGLLLDNSDGDTSSFGAFLQATGGTGGDLGQATSSGATRRAGGVGGVGSGGTINIRGDDGGTGLIVNDNNVCKTGWGGGNVLAPIAQSNVLNSSGRAGHAYGGGSSGASSGFNQGTRAANDGHDGVVIVQNIFLP